MKTINLLILSLLSTSFMYGDFDTKKITDGEAQEQRITFPMEESEQRKWDFSFYQLNKDHSSVYEWVPQGEKTDQWTKLIQIQFVPLDGDAVSAQDFAKAFVERLKNVVPDAIAQLTPQIKDHALVEWSVPVSSQNIQAQDEISQFISAPEGIYRVAYTEKVPAMDPDVKKAWIQRLSEVKLGD